MTLKKSKMDYNKKKDRRVIAHLTPYALKVKKAMDKTLDYGWFSQFVSNALIDAYSTPERVVKERIKQLNLEIEKIRKEQTTLVNSLSEGKKQKIDNVQDDFDKVFN